MNILVIGNGFDLAHGLPTKYTDFLEFCERTSKIYTFGNDQSLKVYKGMNIDNWKMNDDIKTALLKAFEKRECEKISTGGSTYRAKVATTNKALNELYEYIRQNTWLEYFGNCHSFVGENWIDFESEISKVIQALDEAMRLMKNEEDITKLSGNNTTIIKNIVEEAQKEDGKRLNIKEVLSNKQNISDFKVLLERDLNRLVRAFEIYLCEFIERVHIGEKSPDIEELEIDFILSFNYTHIFSKIYEMSERSKREVEDPYDYIHGEAVLNNTIESDTMVLGIDEYLSKKKRNKEIEFIAFKKYYQRIHKRTGCKYKDWLEVIKKGKKEIQDSLNIEHSARIPFESYRDKRHYLYFFGHSLDVTDRDILRELILNDNVYTTIFYHKTYDNSGKDDNGRKDLGAKIANLVKVIGQNELIRRTGGSTKTIEFKLQQDMVERA